MKSTEQIKFEIKTLKRYKQIPKDSTKITQIIIIFVNRHV